jgi:hypothetical protein
MAHTCRTSAKSDSKSSSSALSDALKQQQKCESTITWPWYTTSSSSALRRIGPYSSIVLLPYRISQEFTNSSATRFIPWTTLSTTSSGRVSPAASALSPRRSPPSPHLSRRTSTTPLIPRSDIAGPAKSSRSYLLPYSLSTSGVPSSSVTQRILDLVMLAMRLSAARYLRLCGLQSSPLRPLMAQDLPVPARSPLMTSLPRHLTHLTHLLLRNIRPSLSYAPRQ